MTLKRHRFSVLAMLISLIFATKCFSAIEWQDEPEHIGAWQMWFGTSNVYGTERMSAVLSDNWRGRESSERQLEVFCAENGQLYVWLLVIHEDDEDGSIQADKVPVAYRFDRNATKHQFWPVTANSVAVVIQGEEARSFLAEMNAAEELFISANPSTHPSNLDVREARFLLLGVREIVHHANKLCPDY